MFDFYTNFCLISPCEARTIYISLNYDTASLGASIPPKACIVMVVSTPLLTPPPLALRATSPPGGGGVPALILEGEMYEYQRRFFVDFFLVVALPLVALVDFVCSRPIWMFLMSASLV